MADASNLPSRSSSRIELGDTWADFRAYPTAVPGQAEGNALVIDDPPWPGIFDGVWGWRLMGNGNAGATHPKTGDGVCAAGEGPEPGCC